ncbi:MAG: hypothetical protein M3O41_14325 [Pseudomonadota bacterium]|nr:hypothetical protein [Pseudomonadota bacterium]
MSGWNFLEHAALFFMVWLLICCLFAIAPFFYGARQVDKIDKCINEALAVQDDPSDWPS